MFEETELLGISMTKRAHRRALVVITYAAATVLVFAAVAGLLVRPRGWYTIIGFVTVNVFVVLVFIIGRGVFGRFVRSGFRQFIGPPPRPVQTGLGLAASTPEDEPRTDERDAAVRDHAYYLAYKGLVVGTAFLFPALALLIAVASPRITAAAMSLAMCMFVIVAFTLPQAVILWTELDPVDE